MTFWNALTLNIWWHCCVITKLCLVTTCPLPCVLLFFRKKSHQKTPNKAPESSLYGFVKNLFSVGHLFSPHQWLSTSFIDQHFDLFEFIHIVSDFRPFSLCFQKHRVKYLIFFSLFWLFTISILLSTHGGWYKCQYSWMIFPAELWVCKRVCV